MQTTIKDHIGDITLNSKNAAYFGCLLEHNMTRDEANDGPSAKRSFRATNANTISGSYNRTLKYSERFLLWDFKC